MSEIDRSHRNHIQATTRPNPEIVLIEGGFQNGGDIHQLEHQILWIPSGINTFEFDGYTFTLVAHWKEYDIVCIPAQDYLFGRHGGIVVRPIESPEGSVQRPRTILTQSGRIFHDISLWIDPVEFNREFLERFIGRLQNKYGDENPLIQPDINFPIYTFDASSANLI